MPLDLSLGQKNAFHGRRGFVAGHLAVDAFDSSFRATATAALFSALFASRSLRLAG
jgi:hypothetical protein